MCNIVNRAQKQLLMLNSYLPGINTSIFPKIHYDDIFSEKWSINYMNGYKNTLM